MTYVAVWKGGKYIGGPHKGQHVFTLMALGRTRREARQRAIAQVSSERARRARRRLLVVRYGAALLLAHDMPAQISLYTEKLLAPPVTKPRGFLSRRNDGKYWHVEDKSAPKGQRRAHWGARGGATVFASAPRIPKNANWSWEPVP